MADNLRYGDKVRLLKTIEFTGDVTLKAGTILTVDRRVGNGNNYGCDTEPSMGLALLIINDADLELVEKFKSKSLRD
jgi:hypothetical protein